MQCIKKTNKSNYLCYIYLYSSIYKIVIPPKPSSVITQMIRMSFNVYLLETGWAYIVTDTLH